MNPRSIFRTTAIAEAISWALLLAAMFAKYVLDSEPLGLAEGGVPVAGPVHGVLFVVYVLVVLAVRDKFGWNVKTTLIALAASIPPFCSYLFEAVADRKGLLTARTSS